MSLNIHIIFYNSYPVDTIGNITKYEFNTMYGYKLRPGYISNKSFDLLFFDACALQQRDNRIIYQMRRSLRLYNLIKYRNKFLSNQFESHNV